MGKAYSISDAFMENGLAVLNRAAQDAGLSVLIEDPANIPFYNEFTQNDISPELSEVAMQLADPGPTSGKDELTARFDALQNQLSSLIAQRMAGYINALANKVKERNVTVLGIKTWLGNRFVYSEKLAHKVKQISPQTLIIAGGPQVNQFKSESLRFSPFDFCIDAEGEVALITIVKLAKEMASTGAAKADIVKRVTAMAEQGAIFNLIYRAAGSIQQTQTVRVPLNEKPAPLYENIDHKLKIGVILESSGCHYGKCNFCTHPQITGPYRKRDEYKTINEIKHMIKHQQTALFRFAGSTTPMTLASRLAQRIIFERLNIEYSMFVRPEKGAKDKSDSLIPHYETIINSGLKAVFMGVESANNTILNQTMNKGLTIYDVYHTVKAIKAASNNTGKHIDVGLSFIYPCPTSSTDITMDQVLKDNLEFLNTLKADNIQPDSIMINPAVPLPGTKWWNPNENFNYTFGKDFVQQGLRYEFMLTQDPTTWPKLELTLNKVDFKGIANLTTLMESEVKKLGYTVNVTDEQCLVARSAGFYGMQGLVDFKQQSTLSLLTANYNFLNTVQCKVNHQSSKLASTNVFN